MRVYLAVLAAIFLMISPVLAQSPPVTIYAGKIKPLGYCQLTSLAASTQLTACTGGIPAGASVADVIIETQSVRYRDDGTAPTATVGMLIAAGGEKVFTETDLSALRFIQTTASASLSVSFY